MRLAELSAGKPMILALGYFHCPNLCGVVRADLYNALAQSRMTAGRDYTLVALSIDPAETSADAAAAKASDLARYPLPGAAQDWHFLTGSAATIARDRRRGRLPRPLRPAAASSSCIPPGIVFLDAGRRRIAAICSASATRPATCGSA